MRLTDRFAQEDLRYKRSRERITGTYRIRYLYLRRSYITLVGIRKDIRADSTAGKDEHLQVIFGNKLPANHPRLLGVLRYEFARDSRTSSINLAN